jgi:hypothetical protein
LCACDYPAETQELKNPLRVRKKDKLRRVSAFRHRVVAARSSQRRWKTKVEAFENL